MLEHLLITYIDDNAHSDVSQILNFATKTVIDVTKWQIIKTAKNLVLKIFTWMDAHGLAELLLKEISGMSTLETTLNCTALVGIGMITLWVVAISPAVERWQEMRAGEAKSDD